MLWRRAQGPNGEVGPTQLSQLLELLMGSLEPEAFEQSCQQLVQLAEAEAQVATSMADQLAVRAGAVGRIHTVLSEAVHARRTVIFRALVNEARHYRRLGKAGLPVVEPQFAEVAIRLFECEPRYVLGFDQLLLEELSSSLRVDPSRLSVTAVADQQPAVVVVQIAPPDPAAAQRGEPSVRGAVRMLQDQMLNSSSMLMAGHFMKKCDKQFARPPVFGRDKKKHYEQFKHLDEFMRESAPSSHLPSVISLFSQLSEPADPNQVKLERLQARFEFVAGQLGLLAAIGDEPQMKRMRRFYDVARLFELHRAKGLELLSRPEFELLCTDATTARSRAIAG